MSQDLVTLMTVPSEFEANLLAIVLRDNGIKAFVFGTSALGIGIPNNRLGAQLQVQQDDVIKATQVLTANKRDSMDIDWDELELAGSNAKVHEPATMSLPAKIAFLITAIVLLVGFAISLFLSIF